MAMNRSEKAHVERLERLLTEALAFRLTPRVERDVAPPTDHTFGVVSKGWDYNATSVRVYKACSSSMSHGDGWDRTSCRDPIHLYSTEAKAWAAMRHEIEQRCVQDLVAIDRRLASLNTPATKEKSNA